MLERDVRPFFLPTVVIVSCDARSHAHAHIRTLIDNSPSGRRRCWPNTSSRGTSHSTFRSRREAGRAPAAAARVAEVEGHEAAAVVGEEEEVVAAGGAAGARVGRVGEAGIRRTTGRGKTRTRQGKRTTTGSGGGTRRWRGRGARAERDFARSSPLRGRKSREGVARLQALSPSPVSVEL